MHISGMQLDANIRYQRATQQQEYIEGARKALLEDAALVASLKAIARNKDLQTGASLHSDILERGLLETSPFIASALVSMYAKCGVLTKAREVLDNLPVRIVACWNSLISGYAQGEQAREALYSFEQMQCEGISPNAVTFVCVLKACGSIGAIDMGEYVHSLVARQGFIERHAPVGGALVDMYSRCGALAKAKEALDLLPVRDVISWNALIAGYAQGEHGKEALNCFEMMQCEGLSPNEITFACILKACGSVGALDRGKNVHSKILKLQLHDGNVVLGNALVDMYAKCGELGKAKEVLEGMSGRHVVAWSALISGYVQEENAKEAVECFDQMQREGVSPNVVTFICILKACGSIGALDKGEIIHKNIGRRGLLIGNIALGNALVDMYAKCGALARAKEALEGLLVRDVVSWSALIAGYAQREHGKEALSCFERMQHEGLSPDEVTFLCVLTVCSHSGLLKECRKYFSKMCNVYGILPYKEHHTCMVNLFGLIGLLDNAVAAIKKMPLSNSHAAWFMLLRACKKWGNTKLGKWAFECAVQTNA